MELPIFLYIVLLYILYSYISYILYISSANLQFYLKYDLRVSDAEDHVLLAEEPTSQITGRARE